jgi:hypothetical protein
MDQRYSPHRRPGMPSTRTTRPRAILVACVATVAAGCGAGPEFSEATLEGDGGAALVVDAGRDAPPAPPDASPLEDDAALGAVETGDSIEFGPAPMVSVPAAEGGSAGAPNGGAPQVNTPLPTAGSAAEGGHGGTPISPVPTVSVGGNGGARPPVAPLPWGCGDQCRPDVEWCEQDDRLEACAEVAQCGEPECTRFDYRDPTYGQVTGYNCGCGTDGLIFFGNGAARAARSGIGLAIEDYEEWLPHLEALWACCGP